MSGAYSAWLAGKHRKGHAHGFEVAGDLNPNLFQWQRDVVRWALRKGRAALFEDCGLGKGRQSLAWASHIPGQVLILTPLAVAPQFIREAERIGVEAAISRDGSYPAQITIANYERLHKFDVSKLAGIVLDESGILKAFSGKVKNELVNSFANTPYRLCCTATPAPNDHLELGNHAEFLGVMTSHEMIARWFVNDQSEFGSYRLKGHAIEDYWDWVTSWATCVGKPSDMGYPDDGYLLPPLNIRKRYVGTDLVTGRTDGMLFRIPDLSATSIHQEKRITVEARAAAVAELVAAEPDEQWLVWCDTDYEARALTAVLPMATEVHGSDTSDRKEQAALDFVDGKIRVLISKASIFGFGLNFQNCARQAFVGPTYSYESFYQAVRRTWRFGQTRPVDAHVVMAHTEARVWEVLMAKATAHERMKESMFTAMRRAQAGEERTASGYDPQHRAELPGWLPAGPAVECLAESHGVDWSLYNGDAVSVVQQLPDKSVDFSVFSPPFANLYTYSDSMLDMGNSEDDDEFLEHYAFLVRELHRVMKPGRLVAVHCKELVNYKGSSGMAGLRDFPGEIIRVHKEAGFAYHSRITIWRSPVTEMQKTKAHGLLYKQLRTDSTFSRQGLAEYIVTFRRWPKTEEEEAEIRAVPHTREEFSLNQWQEWASPVWMDVDCTDVLNVRSAREGKDEKHLCPLSLDVIRRCLVLWSNPGDAVLSPFAGIGSEGHVSLELGRRFVGVELKPSYFTQAAGNLAAASAQTSMFAAPGRRTG